MIDSKKLLSFYKKKNINFFTGVPDSVLSSFIKILETDKTLKHFPVYNEGSAISLALGYHLATNNLACVYMQNSGLSNAINPIISIAHKKVYSIPSLLFIGWRGSPFKKKDEPQHNAKGKITLKILELLNIKYVILRKNNDFIKLGNLIKYARKKNETVACLIENKVLSNINNTKQKIFSKFEITRETVIKKLIRTINAKTKIISTTGFTSRELFQIRKFNNLKKGKDFYMVGGMGHAGMVALGTSINKKTQVVCLDGDGSVLMHLGSLKTQGMYGKTNYKHILFNNGSNESVGGQRTFAEGLSFSKIARLLGYKYTDELQRYKDFEKKINFFLKSKGPSFLEIKTKIGSMKSLTRPSGFIKIKKMFKND